MRVPNERIEDLERAVAALREEMRIAAIVPINMVRVAIDRLVDDREVSAAWRDALWRDIERELSEVSMASDAVRRAMHAIPRAPRPTSITPTLPDRDRRPLLRPNRGKP